MPSQNEQNNNLWMGTMTLNFVFGNKRQFSSVRRQYQSARDPMKRKATETGMPPICQSRLHRFLSNHAT